MPEEFDLVGWDNLFKEEELEIVMTKEQLRTILSQIGFSVDRKGFVIDSQSGERVLSNAENELMIEDIGAMMPGSCVFLEKNIASYSQYLSERGEC